MTGKTILILGGGVGGIVIANALRQQLAPEHRVIVVDKRAEYVFVPSLLWVMVGQRRPEAIRKGLRRLLQPGVEVRQAEVQEIDPERQRVRADGQELAYDYLVVALGAELAPQVMPGFAEGAYNFFDLAGAAGLWSVLQRFQGGRLAVLVSAMPYKCPAAPYEAAMLLEDALRRQGIRDRCEVAVFTPETLPMPVAGQAMGQAVVAMLQARGITFHPTLQPDHIDTAARAIVFKDGQRQAFDLLAGVPPHRAPQVVRESPLANPAGWIPVDKHTLQTRFEHTYAIGDVTTIPLANGKPLPKAGVFANGQAEVVAQRIASHIKGLAPQAVFDGLGYCWIETGSGRAGFASGQFYAEPDPMVPPPRAGRLWHWGKVLFEQYWLGDGLQHEIARLGLNAGARTFGVPAAL
ncbi:MAG: NAD(P)/FAD-dependent oxidoreductase [Chloroflexi bacterium]|nr:NAD(P)/FAD-dependent oxidoreductase [Chloroflexota bacterium]